MNYNKIYEAELLEFEDAIALKSSPIIVKKFPKVAISSTDKPARQINCYNIC